MSLWDHLQSAESRAKKHKKDAEKAEAERQARMQEKFGEGIALHAESQKARDIGVADVMNYPKYIWLKARGGEDLALRAEAVKIIKRLKLSSVGVNHDLMEARRYLTLEQYLAETNGDLLDKARATALEKMNTAAEAHKQSIRDYNVAFQQDTSHNENKRSFAQLKTNNPRLFGSEEELNDTPALIESYRVSALPL